jgi:hypothetical protein
MMLYYWLTYIHIHLEWVPGHMDLQGNVMADQHAKKAAEGDVSSTTRLPPLLKSRLPASVSAIKARRKKTLMKRWRKLWLKSPRFAKMDRVDSSMPSRRAYQLLSALPRRASSILVQLRTGHVSLNAFLKKIKAEESALCRQCRQPETVTHYFKHCRRYIAQRNRLRRKAGKASHSIPRLLGDQKIVPHTLQYIQDTQRFQGYNDVAPRDDHTP